MMDVRQLKHFLAVAEHANYARAAGAIGMSQSALTQSILRLEHTVGLKLFERGRFGALMTPAGDLLASRARLVLAEMHRAETELAEMSDSGRGSVTIGLGRSLTLGIVADTIAGFAASRRDVRVTVYEGWSPDLHRRLLQGEFDLVVSSPQPTFRVDADISAEILFHQTEKLLIGRGHELAKTADLRLNDLSKAFWAMPPRALDRAEHLRRVFMASGVDPPTHFIRSDSDTFGQALIREGLAIGMANIDSVARGIADGALLAPPFPQFDIERDVLLAVRRRSRPSRLATALIGAIEANAAQNGRPTP
jgi:DNA-binding transcriptional LysR family regulator